MDITVLDVSYNVALTAHDDPSSRISWATYKISRHLNGSVSR